jgi:hippurate hydrolase
MQQSNLALHDAHEGTLDSTSRAGLTSNETCAYVRMGVDGPKPGAPFHNPHYDFNDDASATGASYWVNVVKAFGASHL